MSDKQKHLRLMTIKKMAQLTGASEAFLKKLLREQKLIKYKIDNATYMSMTEFEELADPKNKKDPLKTDMIDHGAY